MMVQDPKVKDPEQAGETVDVSLIQKREVSRMPKLIGKIIFIGVLFGLTATAISLFFGTVLFHIAGAMNISLPPDFLSNSLYVALVIGTCFAIGWYIYLLALARKYFLQIVVRTWGKKE